MIRQAINFVLFALGGSRPITGPLRVHWDLTDMCNSRCLNCSRWRLGKNKDELTFREGCRLLRELSESGVKTVSFAGNEPLMRRDIFDLLAYAKKLGFNVSLNSNGLLINKDVAKKICKTSIDSVILSVDGSKPEIHDKIRGIPGGFKKVFDALKFLKEAKIYNTSLCITANIVANHINVKDLYNIVNLCKNRGFDRVHIQCVHNVKKYFQTSPETNMQKGDIGILEEQISGILKDFRDFIPLMSDYYKEFRTFYENPDKLYKYRCVACYTIADIRANGDVVPCPVGFKKIGNVTKKSFNDIWFSKETEKLRKEIKENKHPICWFACAQPLNIYFNYAKHFRIDRLFSPKLVRYLVSKVS